MYNPLTVFNYMPFNTSDTLFFNVFLKLAKEKTSIVLTWKFGGRKLSTQKHEMNIKFLI